MEKSVYIVLSQTGTMFSRALKFFTGAPYNHASISLSPTLDKMYSFGRLNPYNPFIGGFVEEGKNIGTFARFSATQAMVLKIDVDEEKYRAIEYFIEYFKQHRKEYKYNYWGILSACFKHYHKGKKRYYCSEFVKTCLQAFNIENATVLPKIIKPIDFLKLNNKQIVYEGSLKSYMSV